MKQASDVTIIGAGIIGCSIACELAREGLIVTVLERGEPGREASWAAAGMLAPQSEAAHGLSGEFSELCHASHRLYPEFVAQLEAETGIKVGYQKPGSVFVAADYFEASSLAGLLERQQAEGRSAEELSAGQVRELEPAISEEMEVGLYLPDDHNVDNRTLMKAVVAAASARGVRILSHTPALGLQLGDSGAVGVRIPGDIVRSDVIVNAAGCWAGVLDTSAGMQLPVRPIRGQMVQLDVQPQKLRHLVHSSGCYLVPWPDGRVLIGATVENVGFKREVTAQGIHQLLTAALRLVPGFAVSQIGDTWAGLRPDTADNLPILGPGRIPGVIHATGHFRNGILLAPITAKLIAELITTGATSISIEAFSCERFESGDKDG